MICKAGKRTGYWKVVAIFRRQHHAGEESPPLGADQTASKQRGPGDDGHVNDKRKKRCHAVSPLGRSVVHPAALPTTPKSSQWIVGAEGGLISINVNATANA
jgi:hypothetical protein